MIDVKSNVKPLNYALASSSTGTFTSVTAAYTDITNAVVSITTTKETKVEVGFTPDTTGQPALISAEAITNTTILTLYFSLLRSVNGGAYSNIDYVTYEPLYITSGTGYRISVPSMIMRFKDYAAPAGVLSYKMQVYTGADTRSRVMYSLLYAEELGGR